MELLLSYPSALYPFSKMFPRITHCALFCQYFQYLASPGCELSDGGICIQGILSHNLTSCQFSVLLILVFFLYFIFSFKPHKNCSNKSVIYFFLILIYISQGGQRGKDDGYVRGLEGGAPHCIPTSTSHFFYDLEKPLTRLCFIFFICQMRKVS